MSKCGKLVRFSPSLIIANKAEVEQNGSPLKAPLFGMATNVTHTNVRLG